MNELFEYTAMMNRLTDVLKTLPNKAAIIAVNFTKERFVAQNWVDRSTEPWKKRKVQRKNKRRNQGAILVDSGRLKRSIRKIIVTDTYAVIGTDVSYAQAHNDGEKINKTVTIHSHERKGHNRHREGRKTVTVRTHHVSSHNRKMKLQLPRRQFIGNSIILDQRIERMMSAAFMRAIKGNNS